MKKAKLTRRANELIDEFGEAAEQYYWQQDQGSKASEVHNSEVNYSEARDNLEKYILRLQRERREYKSFWMNKR